MKNFFRRFTVIPIEVARAEFSVVNRAIVNSCDMSEKVFHDSIIKFVIKVYGDSEVSHQNIFDKSLFYLLFKCEMKITAYSRKPGQ